MNNCGCKQIIIYYDGQELCPEQLTSLVPGTRICISTKNLTSDHNRIFWTDFYGRRLDDVITWDETASCWSTIVECGSSYVCHYIPDEPTICTLETRVVPLDDRNPACGTIEETWDGEGCGATVYLHAEAKCCYKFVKWNTNETTTDIKVDLIQPTTQRIAFFEKRKYTFSVDVNDLSMGSVYIEVNGRRGDEAVCNDTVTFIAVPAPGCALDYWLTCDGRRLHEGETEFSFPVNGCFYFCTSWMAVFRRTSRYTLSCNLNYGEPEEIVPCGSYYENDYFMLPSFERPHYNFLGWSTTSQGDVEYLANQTYRYEWDNDITLYAQWELPQQFHIEYYDYPGHTGLSQLHFEGDIFTLRTPSTNPDPLAVYFLGWEIDGNSTPVTGNFMMPSHVVIARGVWSNIQNPPFSITFMRDYLDSNPVIWNGYTGNELVTLPSASDIGMFNGNSLFAGWEDANYNEYAAGDIFQMIPTNVTFVGLWASPIPITINYNLNGGTSSNPPQPQTISRGENVILNDGSGVTRNGYELIGWSTSSIATLPDYSLGQLVMTGSWTGISRTFFAVWRENPKYSVRYDSNATTDTPLPVVVDGNLYAYGDTVTVLGIPDSYEINGCQASGWATDATASVPEYIVGDTFTIRQNTVLYAVWDCHFVNLNVNNAKSLTIVFNGTEINPGTTVNMEEKSTLDVEINEKECKFYGWLDRDEGYYLQSPTHTEKYEYILIPDGYVYEDNIKESRQVDDATFQKIINGPGDIEETFLYNIETGELRQRFYISKEGSEEYDIPANSRLLAIGEKWYYQEKMDEEGKYEYLEKKSFGTFYDFIKAWPPVKRDNPYIIAIINGKEYYYIITPCLEK